MTVHYDNESLTDLFNSDEFLSELNIKQRHEDVIRLQQFLDSIEINKMYHRTGVSVKNKKYRHKMSKDTIIIKSLKTSLNKMSLINYKTLIREIAVNLQEAPHLYPMAIDLIVSQSLLHHQYCKFYVSLLQELHGIFNRIELLQSAIHKLYEGIISIDDTSNSEYTNLCESNNKTDRLIGYNILISHLEQVGILDGYIHTSIEYLLQELQKDISDEKLFQGCLCIQNIFKILYKDTDISDAYVTSLTELKGAMKSMKIRFKIMDILEKR